MTTYTIETGGTPDDCVLRNFNTAIGGCSWCGATRTCCAVHKDEEHRSKKMRELECPFAKDDVVRIEYRKKK